MNKLIFFKTLTAVVICLAASACTPMKPVTKTVYVGFEMDKKLTTISEAPTPPNKDEFVASDQKKQRDMLYFYSASLSKSLISCQNQLDAVDKSYSKYRLNFEQLTKEKETK